MGELLKKRICRMAFKLQRGVAALILSIGMIGCAGLGGGSTSSAQVDPQKMVADLAAARWEALIKGDFAKAYSYLSPGTRDVMSLDLYKAKIRGGIWKKANVDSVSCEQDQCKVLMAIEYSYRDIKSLETRLDENWLRQDGKWWFAPRR
ncbi:hypothetical protein [Candidatus Nitrotoga sp. 1052]|uniref:hypothetical protein n=1 Tax=Candidatus Nitrotoga sp. 1052 TaxID=2886964 RepID=UPI001EF403E3|nr:hypothetical protein [Candidatus Nitrotoga sp. 1052]